MADFTNPASTGQIPGAPTNFFDYQRKRAARTQQSPTQSSYAPKPTGGVTTTQTGQQPQQQQQQYQPGSVTRPDGRPTPDSGQMQPPPQSYDVGAGFDRVNPMPPAPVQPAQPPTPPPVDRNAIVQGLMKGSGMNEADATAWAERNGYFNPQQQEQQRMAAMGQGAGGTTPGGTGGTGATGTGRFDSVQDYQKTSFEGINSPIYDPTKVNVNLPGMYDGYGGYNFQTQLPQQGYQFDPSRIGQFQGPNQSQTQGGVNQIMQGLLQNPTSMTDAGVSQLKAKQQELALQNQRANEQRMQEQMAQRGMMGGGQNAAMQAAIMSQANKDLLSGYRDVDLKKMEQDFLDKNTVATLGDTLMTGEMGRSTDAYRARLEGEAERELGYRSEDTSRQNLAGLGLERDAMGATDARAVADSRRNQYVDALSGIETQLKGEKLNQDERFKGFDSQSDAVKNEMTRRIASSNENQFGYGAQMDKAKALAGLDESGATRDLQKYLAEKGFGVDMAKIASGEGIAKMGDATNRYGINMDFVNSALNRGQQGSQFNQTLGFNQQGQDNEFFKWLFQNGYGG